MQILTLTLEGIGPFAGRHTIDFRALGQSGLFLLEGPTGAGKTTIIDAIVFALYGDVAGDGSKGRLVCTQLPAGVEPFVDLTVDTSRGLLRVRRVPQHERRKARGTGTTVGKAAIQLWKLDHPDDPGVQVSTSMQDANAELQQALGLTKEQFTQTVVLPQGHFATFLRAKPEERRGVLQDIFGTEFYDRCAKQMATLAAQYRAADAEARTAWGRAASGFGAVAWPDADERAVFEAAEVAEALTLADGRLAELGGAADAGEALATSARLATEAAASELRGVREHNALLAEHAGLTRRRDELLARQPEADAAAERVAAAERAERTRHPLAAVGKARSGLEAARAAAARGVTALAEGPDADLADDLTPEALDAAGLAAREGRSVLGAIVELESALRGRVESIALDERRLVERAASGEQARERIRADRARAAELADEVTALAAVADTRADHLVAEAAAQAQCAAVARLESLAEEFVQAGRAEKAARATATEAAEKHRVARAAWLGGLAGTLAAELVAGESCPVCGSREHPEPAHLPEGAVDRATVDLLDTAARRAEALWTKAQATSDGLATAMADQQAGVGTLTRVEAEAALEQAVALRRGAESAGARLVEVRRTIEALLAGAEARERTLHALEKELAGEQATLAERRERLAGDRRRVAEAQAGFGSVAERSEALARRAELAKRLAQLLRAVSEGESELARRTAELDAALAEEGFADADAARAALLPDADRERLAGAVAQHRAQLAAVAERLADGRLAGMAAGEPRPVEPALAASEKAEAALAAALASSGAASETHRLAAQARAELEKRVADLARVAAAAEPYLAMADLMNGAGANLANVTLPTFVLLRRFEEVVDLANVRLGAMTGGRYSLRRTDAREGRSQKLGLGLDVIDHASGDAARDPKTLSGGETFQASLAMALGLADAVTAEAGGVELNTLFVDEGFGSLDSEALEEVMGQLTALRDGGRCVGVVSHVAEMKQRIAERITVVPRRDGTSTLHCTTDTEPLAS